MSQRAFLIVAATASFAVMIGACGSTASTHDGGTAGTGGSNAGGASGGSTGGRGGAAGINGAAGGGGLGGAAAGGDGGGGVTGGRGGDGARGGMPGGRGGGGGGAGNGGGGGAAGTGAGGAAGGSFSCGDVTCGPTQVCVVQCCGGVPRCDPRPDGGTCTSGSCTTATGQPGCIPPCTPPPRYCVDVAPSCGATLTCSCVPTAACCSVISGRQALCSCG